MDYAEITIKLGSETDGEFVRHNRLKFPLEVEGNQFTGHERVHLGENNANMFTDALDKIVKDLTGQTLATLVINRKNTHDKIREAAEERERFRQAREAEQLAKLAAEQPKAAREPGLQDLSALVNQYATEKSAVDPGLVVPDKTSEEQEADDLFRQKRNPKKKGMMTSEAFSG